MNAKKQYIIFWLAKLPLLLLYISFFAVQLFYNFDISAPSLHTSALAFQNKDKQKDNAGSKVKTGIPDDQKISIRLNKRYHPKPAISCQPVIVNPVVCAVSSKLHIHYSSGFNLSSCPPVCALRGPPVV
jgi:hypothetical protein